MPMISSATIAGWERFYRANFINSLTGFKSVSLIGTANTTGVPNLAIFSSIVHIGSNPPLIGFINRPLKAGQHTIANIRATGIYTLNHINASIISAAHQTSAKYPEGTSEFTETDLTAEFLPGISAPFVKESKVKYALRLAEILPISLNDTFLVIGQVESIVLEESIVSPDGFLDLQAAGTISSNGNDAYYHTTNAGRYSRAKPGEKTGPLNPVTSLKAD